MQKGFGHGLEHILQGADPGKNHGNIQNDCKKPSQGNALQNFRQGHKQQPGACSGIQSIGKAGGQNHQSRNQRRHGIKQGGVPGSSHHVLLPGQVGTVDDHAAAGDGKGEKGLTHGLNPDRRVGQIFPPGGQQEHIACRRAGEQSHPNGQNQKNQEKQGHHDLVGLFDALCAQQQGQKRTADHQNMVGNHGKIPTGKVGKPGGGVRRQQKAGERIHQCLEHIADNHRIADGNAQGTCQRQPAQNLTHLAKPPAFPGGLIGAQSAGARAPTHGKFRRQGYAAEQGNKQQIDQQKRAAAVGAHFVGEAPDICHAYGGAHRGQNEAPAAGKARMFG